MPILILLNRIHQSTVISLVMIHFYTQTRIIERKKPKRRVNGVKKGKTELACGYKVALMERITDPATSTCFLYLLATAGSPSLLSPCFLLLSPAISTAFSPEGLAVCSPFPQSSHCNPQTLNCWSHFCSSSPALTPLLLFKWSPGVPA